MLSNYQLKIADLYNIPISNVKKLVSNFFNREKHVMYYENLQLYLKIEAKKSTQRIRIQSISIKQYVEFSTQKRTETEKNGGKDKKGSCKLMNNAVYGMTTET